MVRSGIYLSERGEVSAKEDIDLSQSVYIWLTETFLSFQQFEHYRADVKSKEPQTMFDGMINQLADLIKQKQDALDVSDTSLSSFFQRRNS